MVWTEVTEADMASNTLEEALDRFGEMVKLYRDDRETMGVVSMYELAALDAGASSSEVGEVWNKYLRSAA